MENQIEAVLLTGGAGRRMGREKAAIPLGDGRADAALAARLRAGGCAVTVLGRTPVDGCAFVRDVEDYQGPAEALSRFNPQAERVFALACDVVRFDPAIIALMSALIAGHSAVVPVVEGFRQPLCALYTSECLATLREMTARGERRLQRWLQALSVRELHPDDLASVGLEPRCVRGANTPDELRDLLAP